LARGSSPRGKTWAGGRPKAGRRRPCRTARGGMHVVRTAGRTAQADAIVFGGMALAAN